MMSTPDELRDARLTDYLEADDPPDVDGLLADDDIARALDDARLGRDLLRGLERKAAPPDFLRKVQRRVRRRSGGRYFHPAAQPFGWGLSVEVFVVIAVVVMTACWFIMGASAVPAPGPLVDEPPISQPAEP